MEVWTNTMTIRDKMFLPESFACHSASPGFPVEASFFMLKNGGFMFNKKLLEKILEELKQQNRILKELESCIRKDGNRRNYLSTNPYQT